MSVCGMRKKNVMSVLKKNMEVSRSFNVFYQIVDWACYVYFQLKSLTKSIPQKNLLKST